MAASFSFDFTINPYDNFEHYFALAKTKIPKDPNAMSLATCSAQGAPSVRTVLFKGLVRGGFSFYTNYESQKARELLATERAALLFYWPVLDMQVRIEGVAAKLTATESATYFRTRARLSQIGAWSSQQSQKIKSHAEVEARVAEYEKKFAEQEIPCPPFWGGIHVVPLSMEFWFAREGRLHDRFVYQRSSLDSHWQNLMKSP